MRRWRIRAAAVACILGAMLPLAACETTHARWECGWSYGHYGCGLNTQPH